jgi:hypothetical protein
VSLFDYLKLDSLKQSSTKLSKLNHRKNNWPFKYLVKTDHQTNRDEVAHFCEHDGIRIQFTRASTTWQAHAPCALKPWWLFLRPLKKSFSNESSNEVRDEISNKASFSKRKQERKIK